MGLWSVCVLDVKANGTIGAEVSHRVGEWAKVWGM